ncbi:MAG: cytosine permease, partial [Pirellulales bacterium]|nr:cytosine permease [Pirellulales bacterium]
TLRSRFPNLSWFYAVLICSLPAILLENPVVFQSYGVYLAYIALLSGTYGGIMIADYFLVNHGKTSWRIRDLYITGPASRYWYWGGFNPAAVIATIAGAGFYLWTLDPLAWVSPNGLFPYITAGIPSFFVSFVPFVVLFFVVLCTLSPLRGPVLSGLRALRGHASTFESPSSLSRLRRASQLQGPPPQRSSTRSPPANGQAARVRNPPGMAAPASIASGKRLSSISSISSAAAAPRV